MIQENENCALPAAWFRVKSLRYHSRASDRDGCCNQAIALIENFADPHQLVKWRCYANLATRISADAQ
jgi:hypothetical protein